MKDTLDQKRETKLIGFTVDFHAAAYKKMLENKEELDLILKESYEKTLLDVASILGMLSIEILDGSIKNESEFILEHAVMCLLALHVKIANTEQIISSLCESRLQEIIMEMKLACNKHGVQYDVTYEKQFLIVYEEYSEVLDDIKEAKYAHSLREIYQTIAMCIKFAWLITERT